jgi:hypothetical protein
MQGQSEKAHKIIPFPLLSANFFFSVTRSLQGKVSRDEYFFEDPYHFPKLNSSYEIAPLKKLRPFSCLRSKHFVIMLTVYSYVYYDII